MTSYPDAPGFKESETSREAAESMAGRAGTLRKLVYDHIVSHSHLTADQIADDLNESPLAIRPRVSELRAQRLIEPCGRGMNRSGKAAHIWAKAAE
jgi:predicted ArsR family transcriptional regulator